MSPFIRIVLFAILSTLNLRLHSQDIEFERILSNTHSVNQPGSTFYQVEGYFIHAKIHYVSFDEKGFRSIMRQYFAPPNTIVQIDPYLPANRFIEWSTARTDNTTTYSKYYILPFETEVKVVAFITDITRDPQVEQAFIKAIASGTMPEIPNTTERTDTILFAGKMVAMPPACTWMKPHNIKCLDMGQMNWAEFRHAEKAHEMITTQIDMNVNISMATVASNDSIPVVFEGIDCMARKIILKAPEKPTGEGMTDSYIVYYVVAEVRGRFVGCVMSYVPNLMTGEKLPQSLARFMTLKTP